MTKVKPTTVKLADVAEINPRLDVAMDQDALVSFVPMAAVNPETASTTLGESRKYSEVRKGYTPFKNGDVLVAKITPCFENGKIAQAQISCDVGFGSTEFHVIRPRSESLDARYLLHCLRQRRVRVEGERKMTGSAGQKRVPAQFLASLEMPNLSIERQREIAGILDHADDLRAKRRESLAQLTDLVQSLFLDMFGDASSQDWPLTSVAEIAQPYKGSIRTGPFGSQLLHSEFIDDGIAVLGIDNAVTNEFRWSERRYISETKYNALKRYTVRPGDVIITIMGTCGRCAIVPDDIPVSINTKHLCCITLDQSKCLPIFLHAYFLLHPIAREYLHRTAKGAIMEGLNMGIIKAMPIRLPPLSQQRLYKDRMDSIEKLRRQILRSRDELESSFASLEHHAFNEGL